MATYIAPAATHIFGTFYAKGATVDVTGWPDRAITEALDRGWITPAAGIATELDPVAGAALTTHKTSTDHDSRYAQFAEAVNAPATLTANYALPDVTTATMHKLTLGAAAITVTLPTPGAGKSFTAQISQDATGGRVLTVATPSGSVMWAGGTAPVWSTAASKRDIVSFVCIDGTNWVGSALLDVR